jgi:solute carrier family 35 protein E1
MMKLVLIASAATAWSLGGPKGLPKLNNRAVRQSTAQQRQVALALAASSTALAASSTALKAVETTGGVSDSLAETLKTGSFFTLWYMFNIGYNIYNKRALNVFPMPWTIATFQLFAGIPYVLLLWSTGVRKTPKLTQENLKTLFPVACGHLGTHIGAVISLGAGAVSFTHIVKASEPVVSAALSAVMLGAFYSPITYLTLLPIVGGVALASLKELSFTWLGFGAAMLSNVSSALRGILAKQTMGGGVGENMNETNLYAVMTIMAFAVLLPISLMVETPKAVGSAINAAVKAGTSKKDLAILSAMSGAYYYLYNEVAFLALGRVNPVTHAVGNTIKRVVIIIASVIAFNTPISNLGIIGSSIAITGTLLYSLAKNKYG